MFVLIPTSQPAQPAPAEWLRATRKARSTTSLRKSAKVCDDSISQKRSKGMIWKALRTPPQADDETAMAIV